MTTTTFPPPGRSVPVALPLRRFTVDEYHRMIRDGYFADDEGVELLEGLIFEKMPRDAVHDAAVEIALALLQAGVPAGWRVRPQCAATTTDSEPEPDLAVVRGTPREYLTRHPGPSDIALIVEVSNSSVDRDRTLKATVYARAGIATYWIINLVDRQVEVYSRPTGPAPEPSFADRTDYRAGQAVPLVVGGTQAGEIPVNELLP
jgi:Uma2 family endonuclease